MYIHRVLLRDVPGIPDRDLIFYDTWNNRPLQTVLLTGPNGSGKTAILRTITSLWDYFGGVLRVANQDFNTYPHTIQWGGLVAIEIHQFFEKPLWVFSAHSQYRDSIAKLSLGSEQVGSWHNDQGEVIDEIGRDIVATYPDRSRLAQQLKLGSATDDVLSNMVFVEVEGRQIRPLQTMPSDIEPEPNYRWLTTYDEQLRAAPLEVKLRYLKIRNEALFQTAIDHINEFLRQNGKEIVGFDPSLRLQLKTTGQRGVHYIHHLSSGEQQCLILIYMINRWLVQGGIALIDEPDLFIHVGLQRALLHSLSQMVQKAQGQLIVSSHSPEIWAEFNDTNRFNLDILQPISQKHG